LAPQFDVAADIDVLAERNDRHIDVAVGDRGVLNWPMRFLAAV